jgi:hypothetical protein
MTTPKTDRETVEECCNQADMGHLPDEDITAICRALLAERDALRVALERLADVLCRSSTYDEYLIARAALKDTTEEQT